MRAELIQDSCQRVATCPMPVASARREIRPLGILQHSPQDALLVLLSLAHGALLLLAPSIILIGAALWWNANTISHNFIHLPFFRSRSLNKGFSLYLSAVLGFPQTLWGARHLEHHYGTKRRSSLSRQFLIEAVLVLAIWSAVICVPGSFFLKVYLPGCLLGLILCHLQGHFEHARGTTSHYGWWYNFLFFNDGYHVEHHAQPHKHWTRLPATKAPEARFSRWPAAFRWLEWINLESLERLVLRTPRLQRFVLNRHERAFRKLLPKFPAVRCATIVGGGMFPRTALILRRILPAARIQIIDACAAHIENAKPFLNQEIELIHQFFDGGSSEETDLLVIPLSFVGDRSAIYLKPAARAVVVHDWIWRKRGDSVVVSCLLLKRLNLVCS